VAESATGCRANHWIVIATLLIAPDVRAQNPSPAQLVQDAGGESGGAAAGKADDQPPMNPQTEQPEKQVTKKVTKRATKNVKKKPTTNAASADSSGENVKRPKHPSWSPVPGVKVEFKARIESELRTDTPASGFQDSELDWQDRRIGVEGTAFKRIAFEVSRELSDDFEAAHGLSEKTAWKDAYVDVRVAKAVNLEAGRFKLPFGREELTAEPSLDFVHRSLAARVLSPGRDVGVMAHGRLFDRRLSYQAGYFTRDGDNGRTSQTEGGRDAVVARLVVVPFASRADSAFAPIEIGVSAAESQVDNRLGLRGRTVLGDGIFFDRLYVNGQRRRIGLDAGWERGPAAVSGEYITLSDERKAMGFDSDDLPNIVAKAWYVAGTWALTGERRHGRVEPRRDLFRGGFGAVELAARAEELRFESASYPGAAFGFPTATTLPTNADRAVTLGVNWYVNHYVKLQSDIVMEWIEDPERSPAPAAGGRFVSPVLLLQFRF
jgi:phosphate-selective porin